MNDFKQLSEAIEEWQSHPITERLRAAVLQDIKQRKTLLSDRYLAGNPEPEETRLALLLIEERFAAFFETDAATLMEFEDEQKRN